MRLYISCDMEGTAGVCSWSQCDPANRTEYPVYRRYMMREVRAAIEGARSAGVDDVVINDSHWDMRNVLWDELPEDVRAISGAKPNSMTQGMQAGFAGAFFTGYHAASGDENGVLAHTYTGDAIYTVRMNGTACSEALLNAAMAGHHGIPVLLLSGDSVICAHVKEHMPWVRTVEVKRGIGHYATDSLTPAAAQALLREAAVEAVARGSDAKLFTFASPITMDIDFARVEQADFVELMPGFVRTGGRSVQFVHGQYPQVFRAFVAAYRLAGAATPAA